jgi:hypothetical protein
VCWGGIWRVRLAEFEREKILMHTAGTAGTTACTANLFITGRSQFRTISDRPKVHSTPDLNLKMMEYASIAKVSVGDAPIGVDVRGQCRHGTCSALPCPNSDPADRDRLQAAPVVRRYGLGR